MIPHRNLLKDIGRLFFWYPVRWVLLLLPFSSMYRVGTLLGYINYLFSGSAIIITMRRNISEALGYSERESANIIRRNLQNHLVNVLEFIKYPQINKNSIRTYLTVDGISTLDNELKKGKGVILATAHFGAKQFMQVGLGLMGYKLNQVHYHMNRHELTLIQRKVSQKMRRNIEDKIPASFIAAGSFIRPAYRCLKNNEVLIVAADGIGMPEHMSRGYLPIPFLGKEMLFPSNMLALAERTGATILPAFVARQEGSHHRLIIENPLHTCPGHPEKSLRDFALRLEKYVITYPYQWEFWEEFKEGTLIANRSARDENRP